MVLLDFVLTSDFWIQFLKFNSYSMSHFNDLIDRLSRDKYLTTSDPSKGYRQVTLAQQSCELTDFRTPWGLFLVYSLAICMELRLPLKGLWIRYDQPAAPDRGRPRKLSRTSSEHWAVIWCYIALTFSSHSFCKLMPQILGWVQYSSKAHQLIISQWLS